jgi:hypothetical protein
VVIKKLFDEAIAAGGTDDGVAGVSGWERNEEADELLVRVVVAVCAVVAVVMLVWEVRDDVRSRPTSFILPVLLPLLPLLFLPPPLRDKWEGDDTLIVTFEAPGCEASPEIKDGEEETPIPEVEVREDNESPPLRHTDG